MEDDHRWHLAFQHATPGSRNDLLVWHCCGCEAKRTLLRLNGVETRRFIPARVDSCEEKLVTGVMEE